MDWSDDIGSPGSPFDAIASPESPFDFPEFDVNNENDDQFFFPSEEFQDFPLSSPDEAFTSPPECPSEDFTRTEEALSDATLTKEPVRTSEPESEVAQDARNRKEPVAIAAQNNSAFSSYILSGLSPATKSAAKQAENHHTAIQSQQTQGGAALMQQAHQPTRRKSRSSHRPGSAAKDPLACSRCHFLKLKCDGEIPCWRCVRKGCGAQCQKANLNAHFVDAPIPWRRNGFEEKGVVDTGILVGPRKSTVMDFLGGMAGKKLGISPTWIDAILSNVTPQLSKALTDTIGKLLATDPVLAKLNPAAMTKRATADAFDMFPSVPYMRQKFDWQNATLTVDINRKLAEFFGAHPEEILDRMSRNTLQPFFTEFDMLCAVLDDLPLMIGGLPNGTSWSQRYHFGSKLNPETQQYNVHSFRSTAKAMYDEHGRLQLIEKWMQPASVEEYDIALEKTPELCRPLQRAAGDRRKGADIVRTHMFERYSESIAAMSFSKDLRRKLDELAAAVKARYAPLVDHVVKKRMEAAAARLVEIPDPQ